MSTRISRKSTTVKSSTETPRSGTTNDTETPPGSSKSGRSARASPLSPTRISRLQEKAELQNLNDRLAAYIDRVRHLEVENNRLNVQVETIQESVQKEVISMKGLYEQELSDARKLLDDTAREKAQLQIDVGKFKTDNEDLRLKLSRKERDLQAAEKALTQAEGQVETLSSKLHNVESDKKKLLAELRDFKDEVNKLTRQLNEAKKQLESETLMRVDLENRCQSLKEDLQFRQQVYEKELIETKSKRHVEISEIDGRLKDEYELKMQDALQELRDQYEEQLRYNRTEIEGLYESKIDDLSRRINKGASDAEGAASMLKDSRSRVSDLSSRLSFLESNNANLQQKVRDLEDQLDRERDVHSAEVLSMREELELLREQMTQHLQDYQDLMDIKIALDMEISAYRKLLESEESRLNLTPSTKSVMGSFLSQEKDTPLRRSPARGLKRKRAFVEEDVTKKADFHSTSRATADVEIVEECAEGRFIRLENKGNKDIPLGGYQLARKANDEEVVYKFHRNLKIPSKSIITIWSSDTKQTHESPYNLVMKNQNWNVSDLMATQLFNNDGEEIATRESKRQTESITTSRHFGSFGEQQRLSGSTTETSPDKCILM